MSDDDKETLSRRRADILRTLHYLDVAAHLLSRGVLSMPEHRLLFALPDEVAKADKLVEILATRANSVQHLIDGMSDPALRDKYKQLVSVLEAPAESSEDTL